MLNVWVLIPTALKDHVWPILAKWRAQGYKIGLLTDGLSERLGSSIVHKAIEASDMLIDCASYPNVWKSWNMLAKAALAWNADVCVLVGDDMDPDMTKDAQTIAAEYLKRFPSGFGVMQPCGDPQGEALDGKHNAARICGSPWVGKGWITSGYGGEGPVNGNYNAFYADEELKIVAENLGVLWMRDDLTQWHHHWSFGALPKQEYHTRNNAKWDADKALFNQRKLEGFLA